MVNSRPHKNGKISQMNKKITISDLTAAKQQGQKFTAVSCYDYTTAGLVAATSIEMILVGDSAAQVILGFDSTLGATMDFMVTITAAVKRAAPDVLLVADMPFGSYQQSTKFAIKNACRFVSQASADIVKIEATAAQIETIKAVSNAGIPTMPHIGIRPQSGEYKAQANTAETAIELIYLAEKMLQAGASMLLLEGTTREVAKIITERLPIPVVSCGSGPDCDGQILIIPDILGRTTGPTPKFSKSYANLGQATIDAVKAYAEEVKAGRYPDDKHCYHIKQGQMDELQKMLTSG
jgi:3-methyl-2-oxobutanoate hydroxymethyltransferase